MKIIRLGYTESSLLFIFYIQKIKKLNIITNNDDIKFINNLINWLYTTSGFYDKLIEGSYFDFDGNKCINSINYNVYMNELFLSLKNCDLLQLNLHNFTDELLIYKLSFINEFNSKEVIYKNDDENMFAFMQNKLYKIISNKNIIIINSFAKLIKQQIDNKNLEKIYKNFPEINNVYCYTTPYTFFNYGNEKSIIHTLKNIYSDIKILHEKYNFDVAIISCGAYSSLVANFINLQLNKDVFVAGGFITRFFGIINKRDLDNNIIFDNLKYWIQKIPDEYKPNNYEKIENGCYW
jgi:hypothetical protein